MKGNPLTEQINNVINSLKRDYKLSLRDIEKGIGYSKDYISGELSTKGGNKTMLKKLIKHQIKMAERANNPAFEVLDIIKEMQVKLDILFSAMAELIAKNSGQSVTVVKEQFERMKNEKLNKP
jgi:butyrate kinase